VLAIFYSAPIPRRLFMSDNRGRGPENDEGRVERNPSRPYENNPVKEQQDKTRKGTDDALNKKR
jgi:hypothetical protein